MGSRLGRGQAETRQPFRSEVEPTMITVRTILRPFAVVAVALGVSLAGGGIAAAAPATASLPAVVSAVQAVDLQPAQIQFQWVTGQQQWAQPNLDRLRRTVFQARADGQFAMVQPDGYPTVIGRISGDGTFEGAWTRSAGSTGGAAVHISGRIAAEQGSAVQMSLTYEAGSVTVARIDDQPFNMSASKVYRAQMVMQGA
jgi:hypothetical protein